MTQIKNVILAGKGLFGTPILLELQRAGFNMTVLTRSREKLKDCPEDVRVEECDYNDPGSLAQLIKIFTSYDAVVSTVSGAAVGLQMTMVEAAIQAGVNVFVPSSFGGMTGDPKSRELPGHEPIFQMRDYLQQHVKGPYDQKRREGMTYTEVICGVPLELVLNWIFFLDFEKHRAKIYDSGERLLSCTTYQTIGKAVAAILRDPASETVLNTHVFIHDMVVTQKMVLESAEKADPSQKWEIEHVSSEEELQKGMATLAKVNKKHEDVIDELRHGAVAETLIAAAFSGKYLLHYRYPRNGNAALGLGGFTKEDLEALVAKRVKGERI